MLQKPLMNCARAYELLRRHLPVLKEDRALNKDIETLRTIVHSEGFVKAVESLVGRLS